MRKQSDSTTVAELQEEPRGELVSIFVPDDHPLLRLKRALDWEAIQEVMVKHWRAAGKNVDLGRGREWPVGLYVPLVVLTLVKAYHSRQSEEYAQESVVARRFLGLSHQRELEVRDHANIARAIQALGEEGVAEVNRLVLAKARELGFTSTEILSSDTTVQEPKIGYPHEPGILKGLAERCERALKKLKRRGVKLAREGIETAKEIYRKVRHHHLFAKTTEERREILRQIVEQAEKLIAQSQQVTSQVGEGARGVKQRARAKLKAMGEVARELLPQIKYWMEKGKVAANKIIHAGLKEARAIVSDKAGRRVRFGFKWLIHRFKGGYLAGRRVKPQASEYEMPIESLKDYRELFGPEARPKIQIYDRGGRSVKTIEKLKQGGIKKLGLPPRGQEEWLVGEKDQKIVKSERGKTEGSIGRLKSRKYGFSGRQERSVETQTAVGQRAIVSANLNTLMRDLVGQAKAAGRAPC
jgi:hypothetical protein